MSWNIDRCTEFGSAPTDEARPNGLGPSETQKRDRGLGDSDTEWMKQRETFLVTDVYLVRFYQVGDYKDLLAQCLFFSFLFFLNWYRLLVMI